MKTADFRSELTPNGQIAVPPEIAAQVPPGEQVQVVLCWASRKTAPYGERRDDASSKQHMPRMTQFTNL